MASSLSAGRGQVTAVGDTAAWLRAARVPRRSDAPQVTGGAGDEQSIETWHGMLPVTNDGIVSHPGIQTSLPPLEVVPAQAGILFYAVLLDPRLRGDDQ